MQGAGSSCRLDVGVWWGRRTTEGGGAQGGPAEPAGVSWRGEGKTLCSLGS